jgi:hypothetical protein
MNTVSSKRFFPMVEVSIFSLLMSVASHGKTDSDHDKQQDTTVLDESDATPSGMGSNKTTPLSNEQVYKLCNKWSRASIQFEARVGTSYNCEDNAYYGSSNVSYEACWEIRTAQDLCYRKVGDRDWIRAGLGER